MKKLSIGFAIGLFAVSAAIGDPAARTTKITFSQSVRVPGTTLTAGTYYFTRPAQRNRMLVRIENENRQFVAQFMGIADYTQPADHTMIVFGNNDCSPKAIKLWLYPDSPPGVRFVYSKEEAESIAASCNELVPETDLKANDDSQVQGSNVKLMSPQKKEEPYKPESLSNSDQSDKDGFDSNPR